MNLASFAIPVALRLLAAITAALAALYSIPAALLLQAAITAALAALYFDLPGRLDRFMGWFWATTAGLLAGAAAASFLIERIRA